MKLSIVIPVYKVEHTLDRCLESIVSQTFSDIEVILVDDGSPDRCPQMCDVWAKRDTRIQVIHKHNGGLSDARNAGIDKASGDYITFVDSDDYLDHNTYLSLMAMLGQHPEYDIIEFPVSKMSTSKKQTADLHWGDHQWDNARDYWLKGRGYQHTYAWNKIYKRHLFSSIRYPAGKVFEDAHILPLLLAGSRIIATTDTGRYYYQENPQGITMQARGKELASLLEAHMNAIRQMDLLAQPSQAEVMLYYMHMVNLQLTVCALSSCQPLLPPLHVSPGLPGLSPIERIKAIALNIIGIKRLCQLYRTLSKLTGRYS